MRPGQGDRQLDQPQGRRGRDSSSRRADPRLRRRASSSWRSTRRARPTHGAQGRDLPRAYKLLTEQSASRPRTSSSTPTSSPSPPASRSTTATASTSSRRRGEIKASCPRARSRGGVSTCRSLPRQRRRARGDALGRSSIHAIQAGHGHGHRQRRPARVYDDIPRTARARRGRDPRPRADATERCSSSPTLSGERPEARSRTVLARGTVEQAARARARQRHRRLHRGRHRGGAPELRAAARGDRRPADGRHERRRRPVRRRQDVPAAGGQDRPRDEEGRGALIALHRGREGKRRRARRARSHGHGQGRRARHRQEHRRRGPRLQQLRGDRPRRDGAVRQDPRSRDETSAT